MPKKGYKQTEEHKRNIGKSKIPWNTGLTKETDMRVAQISIGLMGKKRPPFSEDWKQNISNAHLKFSKEEEQQICNDYFFDETVTLRVLADKNGCNHMTIGNIIKRNGYTLRKRGRKNLCETLKFNGEVKK